MRIKRIIRIASSAVRHRLDRLIPAALPLPWWLRVLLAPLKLIPAPNEPAEVSIRLFIEELGPVFVKFGQILSTRRDIFPPVLADELQKLQDQVPPFDNQLAREIVETSLEAPVGELFLSFDETPLASASVAQVHGATLPDGSDVVVKIIRPGIRAVIQKDLEVMYLLARLIESNWEEGRRLHPVDIVADYERTILDELNLQLEAANATQLRKNWLNSGKLYVPEVYWDYTRPDVMVMERIYGISSANLAEMHASHVNMKKLAHLGVEIFFTQVFEQNFFHADMHPGNVFVDISDPENPSYIGLDCAIIGSLTESDKDYLARNLLAFFNRDYYEVARLHVESEWVPSDTDIKEFESVIRSVCEPIFQKPISEISFGRVLISLFQTARRFNMEVQPQLVLLQKTLLNIEGMGRQLYPELDLWETAAPYMERWMENRMGLTGLLRNLRDHVPGLIGHLPELPGLAAATINELKLLGQNNRRQTRLLASLQTTLEDSQQQKRSMRIGGSALLGAFILALLPAAGMAAGTELMVGSSLLGSFGIYWMFIK
ncbi:MAG: ubiquinone biosynthesis regulatory protein kinase UbiB [Pseudomonadales bacterium]|nr:ubiquinone biosynthesis regulatory protein kinase UbiB [Pseudomonadales bacterium]